MKSSADSSHVVHQYWVLFWGSELFVELWENQLCFRWRRRHASPSTPACPVRLWEWTSGGPVRPWSSRGSITRLPLWAEAAVPGGFCNVILLEWERKKCSAIQRKIEKAAAVQTGIPARLQQTGCECWKVCGTEEQAFSLLPDALWSSDVSLQTADPDLIGKNPSAVVWDLVDCLDNLQIVHVVHVAAVSCLISGNNGWSYIHWPS